MEVDSEKSRAEWRSESERCRAVHKGKLVFNLKK